MNITYGNTITVADYNNLRKSVGWTVLAEKQAQAGIDSSACLVVANVDNNTVGMARLITDGGYIAFIADVMVLPKYQKNGIGKALMNMIMAHIQSNLEIGDCVYVGLMASKGREDFYKHFGFDERPNDYLGAGMSKWITL
jgi:GNAT superfamily N-acetyltransferase